MEFFNSGCTFPYIIVVGGGRELQCGILVGKLKLTKNYKLKKQYKPQALDTMQTIFYGFSQLRCFLVLILMYYINALSI